LKRYIPSIFILLIVTAAVVLFITDKNRAKHRLDERISFRKDEKVPYGMYVAYENLKYLFPQALILENRQEPGYWNSLSVYDSGQALIIITPYLFADEYEMKKIISFVESGNDVFISTRYVSGAAEDVMQCKTNYLNITEVFSGQDHSVDSLLVSLIDPPFRQDLTYSYPGKKYSSYFDETNTATTDVLGKDKTGRTNFVHLRAGKGNLYMQLAPLAFSNYFLLHRNNISYYENALSLIAPGVTKVVWDEYYLNKKWLRDSDNKGSGNWLSVLFRYPGLKAALLTAIFTLLLFVVLEMRRKQRYIPVIARPRNDSMDFVRTIGRLYYDKGDHRNLCRKMAAYFLEHIRNRYKLPTSNMDEDFIKNLQFKTGCPDPEIRGIVSFIKYLDEATAISDKQLSEFHKQLESFYTKA
jgi:hypothetical protein